MRYRGRAGGGRAVTHIPADAVTAKIREWAEEGIDPELITFHESMPDESLQIQGEVARDVGGLNLSYSVERRQAMREAMEHPSLASGLSARLILEYFLDANSREDIDMLLDLYPDAVIEFGTYERDVGLLPRRNTVIWEVRNY